MILVIDNYDSFTYNLVQFLLELDEDVQVVRRAMADFLHVKERGQRLTRVALAARVGGVDVRHKIRSQRVPCRIGVVELAERSAGCFGGGFRLGDGIGLTDVDS